MKRIRIAVPDMITNSYFPLLAACELGILEAHGLDAELVLMSPADRSYRALGDGHVHFVGAEAHAALAVFERWQGMKFICAQSQGMYWFLVMRKEFGLQRGDLHGVRNRKIGASPWVELGLKRMLIEAGIDPARDRVHIGPIPGGLELKVNTGVTAAKALESGVIDGFWANGMGAEIAVRGGIGTTVIDARRGDGPKGAFDYTFPAVATTDRMLEHHPEIAADVVRSIVAAHHALRDNVSLAAEIGRRLFPPQEAALIETLINRDLPFYEATIHRRSMAALNRFCIESGLLDFDQPYEQTVATQFDVLWRSRPSSLGFA
jgi:NitT/TauT family transport system substrate-binding protein